MKYVVTLVAAAVVAAYVVPKFDDDGGASRSHSLGHFEAWEVPGEFLYLDSARVLNYLAELEGGKAGLVRRISKELHSENAALAAEGVTLGVNSQNEDEVESTLAPTASSDLGVMLKDLWEDTTKGVSIHDVTLQTAQELEGVSEGWLVRFATRRLLAPGYLRPYLVVRHSATAPALFPREGRGQAAKGKAEAMWSRAKVFGRRVGPNPRATLDIEQPPLREGESPVRLLLPIEYRDLTSEREMLEGVRRGFVGGKVFVVGEVLGVLRPRSRFGRRLHPKFVDYAARESWRGPIRHASNSLIKRIGGCRHAGRKAPARRRCLLHELQWQTELSAPGVVILPLAIYK